MNDRRDRLNSAERGTFDWALAEGDVEVVAHRDIVFGRAYTQTTKIDVSFTQWLEGEAEGLFCFMGKPGSGKSTLMKYIATNPKVDQALDSWAKGKPPIRAEHFFWILGGPVQKSREGLLRHLLHSALLSLPPCADGEDLELAKRICGTRRLSSNFQRAWTYDELFEMLSRLTALPDAKFFFLIDALDECEPQDRLGELADEVIRISQLPDVKLCSTWTD
ncbi:hypothetical protein WHR41_04206 [Cladosporium halotolerans]|uniref:Nephrocystin 3-like N-terminal domain-containing protein n=1 Tax=Cladosporium halotolerans TaxID=1052096 RepID=A0AB34KPM5_9PEZI